MKFRYINSREEILDLSEFPYLLQSGDLLNYSWTCDSDNNRITNVRREAGERAFKVGLIPDWSLPYAEKRALLKEAAERLYSVFEYDVVNNTDGRIETDTGSYLPCRVLTSEKSDWENPTAYMFYDLTAVSGLNAWITEQSSSYYKNIGREDSKYLDYPLGYERDYTPQQVGRASLYVNHITPSKFKMTIFGACVNPRIVISNHIYQIYTSLSDDEYLVVDSRDNTIVKHLSNGLQENIYNLRAKEQSVFETIPPLNNLISWDGSFGFDLTLYLERSEPAWS